MTSHTAAQLRVHRWGWVALGILAFGVLVLVSEGIVRFTGFTPYRVSNAAIEVNPGGKLFTRHPTLGYSLIPGKFMVTLGSRYSFNVTHLHNTLRITHPIDSYVNNSKQKEEIWIFGCSYTHGWGLNDQETYPWLLQERFPEYEIVNFGVVQYGMRIVPTWFKFGAGEEIADLLEWSAVLQGHTHQAGNDIVKTDQLRGAVWSLETEEYLSGMFIITDGDVKRPLAGDLHFPGDMIGGGRGAGAGQSCCIH